MNMNSGYCGWSMSQRAADAYADGEKPMSKWTKRDILDAISEYELDPALFERVRKLKKKQLCDHFIIRSSWHHTSKVCNRTDFYSVDEEAVYTLTDEKLSRIEQEETQEQPKAQPKEQRVSVTFTEWVGRGRYSRKYVQTCTGTKRGNIIELDEESKAGHKTKRADGSHIDWRVIE